MCDPLTLGAMAMTTAGAFGSAQTTSDYYSEVNNQNKIAFEMADENRRAEQVRQDAYDAQAYEAFDATHDAVSKGNYDATQQQKAQSFIDTLSQRPDVLNLPAVDEGASDAVKQAAAARTSKEASKSRDRIKALAALTSHGGTGADRARTFGDNADFLSTLGGLRRGSLGVAAQEQSIGPAQVHRGDDTFAQILSGAGMLTGMAGPGLFSGWGAAASGAPTASLRPLARPAGLGI